MQRWRKLKTTAKRVWQTSGKLRISVLVLLGLALLAGIGLGVYGQRAGQQETAGLQPLGREELELVVQAQVENVLARLYPWVLEAPTELVSVEPPPGPAPLGPKPEPEAEGAALSLEDLLWPVQGEIQTPFGWYRHPVYGDWRFNTGIEFSAPGEMVHAVLAGQVVSVISDGLETELVLDHGGGWTSTYRSVKALTVAPGERVERNQEIAVPHNGIVFFGLNHNHEPVNPQAFLR